MQTTSRPTVRGWLARRPIFVLFAGSLAVACAMLATGECLRATPTVHAGGGDPQYPPIRAMDHGEGAAFLQDYGSRVEQAQRLITELRAYAVLSANAAASNEFRAFLVTQWAQRRSQYQQLVDDALWRGVLYLDGSIALIGIQSAPPASSYVVVDIQDMTPETLGIDGLDISTRSQASDAISDLDAAVDTLVLVRSNLAIARFQLGFGV